MATISLYLASKLVVEDFPVWASKPVAQFGDLGLKITTMVFWFVPQNHVGYGLSVAPQNRWEDEDGVRHVSRFSNSLHLEASHAMVS
jgi:hypothetical protein